MRCVGQCACAMRVCHWHIVVNANRSHCCYCFHFEFYLFIQFHAVVVAVFYHAFHIPHLFMLFYCWSCTANATMSMLIGFPSSLFHLSWHVHTAHSSSSSPAFHLSFIFVREIKCCLFYSAFGIRINKYINSKRAKPKFLRYVRSFLGDGFANVCEWSLKSGARAYVWHEMGEKIIGKKTWAIPHWFNVVDIEHLAFDFH